MNHSAIQQYNSLTNLERWSNKIIKTKIIEEYHIFKNMKERGGVALLYIRDHCSDEITYHMYTTFVKAYQTSKFCLVGGQCLYQQYHWPEPHLLFKWVFVFFKSK